MAHQQHDSANWSFHLCLSGSKSNDPGSPAPRPKRTWSQARQPPGCCDYLVPRCARTSLSDTIAFSRSGKSCYLMVRPGAWVDMEVVIPSRRVLSDNEARFADLYRRYGRF